MTNRISIDRLETLGRIAAVLYAKLRAVYTPGDPRTVALQDAIALLLRGRLRAEGVMSPAVRPPHRLSDQALDYDAAYSGERPEIDMQWPEPRPLSLADVAAKLERVAQLTVNRPDDDFEDAQRLAGEALRDVRKLIEREGR